MVTRRTVRRVVATLGIGMLCCVLGIGAILSGFCYAIIAYARAELPTAEAIHANALLQDAIVLDRNGEHLGRSRVAATHREVVPIAAMSPHLVHAVVASEDTRFFEHAGVDPYGIARAFATIVRSGGDRIEGGSTITQQLLKLFVLRNRPSLLRKVEEAMLASAFEEHLTKEQLLELYLSTIYLGHGQSGIGAASRWFFGKPSSQLTVAESALLIGFIPEPAHLSPFCAPERARERQQRVLNRLVATGHLDGYGAARAAQQPLAFMLADSVPDDSALASAVDLAFPSRPESGTIVTMTVDRALQIAAHRALTASLDEYARARGEHRGPRFVLKGVGDAPWFAKLRALRRTLHHWRDPEQRELLVYELRMFEQEPSGDPCSYGAWLFRRAQPYGPASGIVVRVDAQDAYLELGDLTGTVSAASIGWTKRSLADVAPIGAVVDVTLPSELPSTQGSTVAVELRPRPRVEGAVVVLHPPSREVLAAVGGYAFERGDFHRAVAAQRPIGSTVKPFVFGAGFLSGALLADSEVFDVPIRYTDPWSGSAWEPRNWYHGHDGPIPIDLAMARSVNLAAVDVAFRVGVDRVALLLEEVSPVGRIPPDPAVALGAFERTPLELANAFATIADGGRLAPIQIIREELRGGQRVQRAPASSAAVLDPSLVKTLDGLLTQPIEHPRGTARRLQRLALHIRGKTGTTNSAHDAWFVGYTDEFLVVVWVGYDQPASLRTSQRDEGGGTLAAPVAETLFAFARDVGIVRRGTPASSPDTLRHALGTHASAVLRRAFDREEVE